MLNHSATIGDSRSLAALRHDGQTQDAVVDDAQRDHAAGGEIDAENRRLIRRRRFVDADEADAGLPRNRQRPAQPAGSVPGNPGAAHLH
jgi:hypothetical protein